VLRHEHVLGDVHEQLALLELLNQQPFGGLDLGERLARKCREVLLHDEDRALHVLLVHPLHVLLDRLDADLRVHRPEDEDLLRRVVALLHEQREHVALRRGCELLKELLLGLVDVGGVDHVPTVAEHLQYRPPRAVDAPARRVGHVGGRRRK